MNVSAVKSSMTPGGDIMGTGSVSQEMGKDAFLKLLVTQLQNQDPLEPMDNKDLILQLSQFSTLEQTQNLNKNFQSLLVTSNLGAANTMIGKDVDYYDADNGYQLSSGHVKGITLYEGEVFLDLDGKFIKMSNVAAIREHQPNSETEETEEDAGTEETGDGE
jgi:flagellar basal-body rod modification protein FlgD